MFTVDLRVLDRKGAVSLEGHLPPDDPIWSESGLVLATPLQVGFEATSAGQDEVRVAGHLRGRVEGECVRCLKEVETPVDLRVDWYFIPPDELGDEGDPEVRILDPRAVELDLTPLIREEMILAAPRFPLCGEGCRGLCPRCGVDWNLERCECREEVGDPRWDALRSLPSE